jgi:hypothetical protein
MSSSILLPLLCSYSLLDRPTYRPRAWDGILNYLGPEKEVGGGSISQIHLSEPLSSVLKFTISFVSWECASD